MNINFDGLVLASMMSQKKTDKKKVFLTFIMTNDGPTLVATSGQDVVANIARINSEGKLCAIKWAQDALEGAGCDTSWASWTNRGAIELESYVSDDDFERGENVMVSENGTDWNHAVYFDTVYNYRNETLHRVYTIDHSLSERQISLADKLSVWEHCRRPNKNERQEFLCDWIKSKTS